MNLSRLVTIFLFSVFLTACQKPALPKQKTEIESLAYKTLSEKMNATGFNDLDWDHSSILKSNSTGFDIIIRIPSHINPNKVLYFGNLNNTITYSWSEIKNAINKNGKTSAEWTVSSLDNETSKTYIIKNNKISQVLSPLKKQINSLQQRLNDEEPVINGSGGDAVVTGIYKNNPYNYWSVYLLLGGAYTEMFAPNESGGGPVVSNTIIYIPANPNNPSTGTNTKLTNNGDGTITVETEFTDFLLTQTVKITYKVNGTTGALINNSTSIIFTGLSISSYSLSAVQNDLVLSNTLYFDMLMQFSVGIIGTPISISFPETWRLEMPVDFGITYTASPIKLKKL